jgi:hypothetical protein
VSLLFQVEYLTCWLDHYHLKQAGTLVGFLKEFREQQEKGETSFQLPPVPQ